MGKLILIRHGQTDKNINNNLHAPSDAQILNDMGVQQMKRIAYKLTDYSPTIVYSSKEQRALQSAEIIANTLKIPLKEVEGMQERNWGVFTGKSWEDVEKVLNPMTLDERYTYVPAGGESWQTFETRLIAAVKRIIIVHPTETILVVTHGGVMRALMPYLLNESKEKSFDYDFDNASMTIFDFEGEKFNKVSIS